jgi:hypothetical protein
VIGLRGDPIVESVKSLGKRMDDRFKELENRFKMMDSRMEAFESRNLAEIKAMLQPLLTKVEVHSIFLDEMRTK